MFDVSAITSYINTILSFIVDNIAIIIGVLIVIFSIRSSRRKKRRAEAESRGEVPSKKSFMERMAEMEAELNQENAEDDEERDEAVPPHPYRTVEERARDIPTLKKQPPKRKESPWDSQEPAPEGPGNDRVKPSISESSDAPWAEVASVSAYYGENSMTQSKIPMPESIDIRIAAPPMTVIQLDDDEGEKCGFSLKGKLNRRELADAVVMAEILDKPKALRRAGHR